MLSAVLSFQHRKKQLYQRKTARFKVSQINPVAFSEKAEEETALKKDSILVLIAKSRYSAILSFAERAILPSFRGRIAFCPQPERESEEKPQTPFFAV